MKFFNITFLAFVCLLVCGCIKHPSERIIFDFETDKELNQLNWKCHTLLTLTDEHVTHGTKSLKLDLFPSEYPGLEHKLIDKDWRGFKDLQFDVYNSQNKTIYLSLRIDDKKNSPDYHDRYQKVFELKPGHNTLVVGLGSLTTSGSNRLIDLSNIYRLMLFLSQPKSKVTLYFDHIRLLK